jgi:hypothetical protein
MRDMAEGGSLRVQWHYLPRHFVMAGLDPAIHVFASGRREDVDVQHNEPVPTMTSQQKVRFR